jgi:multidrug efflux system membrane fusion protein
VNRSIYLSIGLLLLVLGWILSGTIMHSPDEPETSRASRTESIPLQTMKVAVQQTQARQTMRKIIIQGETQPFRQVELRAQISSHVIALPAAKGQSVGQDEAIVALAKEDRPAQVARAKAEVASQRHEVAAAQKLSNQGLQSQNRLKAAQAALAAAKAELKSATLALNHTSIKTPFAGILEQRHVELGSQVQPGEPIALLVDNTMLKAIGQVPQQSVKQLRLGQPVHVRLLDGQEADGEITFISRLGDAETHSFRMEVAIPNPDGRLNAGASAELYIKIGEIAAHFISPALLSLNPQGSIGVKSVNSQGQVQFYPTELMRSEADGVWVTGLPPQLNIITQGQGFVNEGENVIAVPTS